MESRTRAVQQEAAAGPSAPRPAALRRAGTRPADGELRQMAKYSTYSRKTESSQEAVHAVKQEIKVEIDVPLPTGPEHVKMEPKDELVKEEPLWMEEEPACSHNTESSLDTARTIKQEVDIDPTLLQPKYLPWMEPKLEMSNEETTQCGREDSGENRFMDNDTELLPKKRCTDKSEIQCAIESGLRCEICKKLFIRKQALNVHMLSHTTDHRCKICKKYFADNRLLKIHMVEHTDQKDHRCEICKKCFAKNKALKRHMVIHTGQSKHRCEICEKYFSENSSLKRHMVIHTEESDYRCEICKICYVRKGDLTRHMVTHKGQLKHQCEICQKYFAQKEALTMHMVTHTDQLNYRCTIC